MLAHLPLLIGYALLFVIGMLCPYGDVLRLPFAWPSWALSLIGMHFLTTVIFCGVPRFHEPIDAIIILAAFLGTFMTMAALLPHLLARLNIDPGDHRQSEGG